MRTEERTHRVEAVLNHRQPDLTVVIENVHDPHNVSAILRSCDAVGILEIQLVYTEEDYPEIGKKSSASASKWIERRKFNSIESCYAALRNEGYTILATRLDEKTKSLYELDLTRKVALVLGNEHRGVSDEAADSADGLFKIPMFGFVESLNVSVACAVTLFETLRQRMHHPDWAVRKLPDERYHQLLNDWLAK